MKFCIVFLTVGMCFGTAFGQLNKGSWMIGGNLSVNKLYHPTIENSKPRAWNISTGPTIGYLITSRLAAGLQLNYSYTESKFVGGNSGIAPIRNHTLGVNPFVRYYLLAPGRKINLFPELAGGYGVNFEKSIFQDGNSSSWNYRAGIGATAFITSSAALELVGAYSHYKTIGQEYKVDRIQSTIGFIFFFGRG